MQVTPTFTLASGGSAAFLLMETGADAPGLVTVLSEGTAPPSTVELSLIRTR